MTPDELQAAAERLGRYCDGLMPDGDGLDQQDGYRLSGAEHLVTCLLVAAYFAEHPADDGEPVTGSPLNETWLPAVGFTYEPDIYGPTDWWRLGKLRFYPYSGGSSRWTYDGVSLPDQPTRGHVRRLCAALGIPLAEGGAT